MNNKRQPFILILCLIVIVLATVRTACAQFSQASSPTPISIGALALTATNIQYPQMSDPLLCTGKSHDDTTAIQAAINAAATSLGSNYWVYSVRGVVLPAGYCYVTSLTLPPRVSLVGQGQGQTILEQKTNTGLSMIVQSPISSYPTGSYPGNNPSQWDKTDYATIAGFSGVGSTGNKYGIEFSNATAKSIASHINEISLNQFTNSNIYVGLLRIEGSVDHSVITNSHGYNIENHGNDWYFANTQLGSSDLANFAQLDDGCTKMVNMDIYSSFTDNIYLGPNSGCYFLINNASLDRAKQSGLHIATNHVVYSQNNIKFNANSALVNNIANSSLANGTYPHIWLDGSAGSIVQLGNYTVGQDTDYPNKANYIIQQSSPPTQVTIGNQQILTSNLPYTIAPWSDPTNIGAAPMESSDNMVINGDFVVSRRYGTAAFSSPNGTNLNGLDHWVYYGTTASGKYTCKQDKSTPPTGFTSDMLCASNATAYTAAATDVYWVREGIEGNLIADLGWGTTKAKPAILSWWMLSSLTGQFGGVIANAGSTRFIPFTCSYLTANVWQYCSMQTTGDTTGTWSTAAGTTGARIVFDLGTGTNGQSSATAGAVQSGNSVAPAGDVAFLATGSATYQITGVRLRKGFGDIGYVPRPLSVEQTLTARYYQNSFPDGTRAGQNAGTSGCFPIVGIAAGTFVRLFPQMMVTPTIATDNPAAANANWRDLTASTDLAISVDPSSVKSANGFQLAFGAAASANDNYCVHWEATAETP